MIDEERIHKTHAELSAAKTKLYNAIETEITAKLQLDKARAAALVEGKIVGKNEAERDACSRQLLASFYDSLVTAEGLTRFYRLTFDQAALDWEAIKVELRWLEIIEGGTKEEVAP